MKSYSAIFKDGYIPGIFSNNDDNAHYRRLLNPDKPNTRSGSRSLNLSVSSALEESLNLHPVYTILRYIIGNEEVEPQVLFDYATTHKKGIHKAIYNVYASRESCTVITDLMKSLVSLKEPSYKTDRAFDTFVRVTKDWQLSHTTTLLAFAILYNSRCYKGGLEIIAYMCKDTLIPGHHTIALLIYIQMLMLYIQEKVPNYTQLYKSLIENYKTFVSDAHDEEDRNTSIAEFSAMYATVNEASTDPYEQIAKAIKYHDKDIIGTSRNDYHKLITNLRMTDSALTRQGNRNIQKCHVIFAAIAQIKEEVFVPQFMINTAVTYWTSFSRE